MWRIWIEGAEEYRISFHAAWVPYLITSRDAEIVFGRIVKDGFPCFIVGG